MPYDHAQTIDAFLTATAAKQPTPGGGSVAALAGALSSAIGEMVVSYSLGKKDLADHQQELHNAQHELQKARQVLLELMLEDQLAYEALTAARKAAGERRDTDPQFAAALLACVRIPQAIGATAGAILELCERLVPCVNKHLLSDLAVCAELAVATVRCAAYNVRINLGEIADNSERARFSTDSDEMIAHAVDRVKRVIPAIWKRVG